MSQRSELAKNSKPKQKNISIKSFFRFIVYNGCYVLTKVATKI